jgi:hypothetical protein
MPGLVSDLRAETRMKLGITSCGIVLGGLRGGRGRGIWKGGGSFGRGE